MMEAAFLNICHKREHRILITYLATAQGLDYSGLATLYGIDFVRVANNDELENALQNDVGTAGVHVIEIPHLKNIVGSYIRNIRKFLQIRRNDYEPIFLQYYR